MLNADGKGSADENKHVPNQYKSSKVLVLRRSISLCQRWKTCAQICTHTIYNIKSITLPVMKNENKHVAHQYQS